MVDQDVGVVENSTFDVKAKAVILTRKIAVKLRGHFTLDNEVEGRVPRHNTGFFGFYTIGAKHPFINLIGDVFPVRSVWG